MTEPIVIAGSGLAGYNLAREFRKLDRDTPLMILSRDAAGFYSKPMLSNALSAGKTPESLVMKTADKMAGEVLATIRPHVEIAAIEPADRIAVLASGERIAYRDLVLAIGADPIRLPIGGDGAGDVLSVNDLDDFARFAARLDGAKRVVVLGAGLIGCEFANDMLARGIAPTVIDIAAWPLGRLLPEAAAGWFRQQLEAAGVTFRMNVSATTIERSGDAWRVALNDGSILDADLVLSAVGLRPRTALAAAAGLSVNRGVRVDRLLATSDAHIHALGDCAEVEGLVLPFVMPIMHQARALAATLAGKPTPVAYPAMPVVVKTPACPTVVCPPAANAEGRWHILPASEGERGVEAQFLAPDGTLLGFALLGAATARKQALTAQAPAALA
ncbi:NAD(P)/FAD-dependent oxidoreductase [Aromatoleum petrolei]|uniref:FAD-dependent oxidoreductase n=1 Tax=Aromatoleum petrolei TaxID=76116 RepID=A0ABX1MZY2_9RHOO|nr:FAD-dependent oxidoreductase [Aromatoleum petrolei]NMF91539.1 FAD-dependent oxidoreductase [Aromatoleum petrolei]QTQ34288.1 Rubredoxin-NAD(+) reductase [Aromatoleum petrolei]